jgi:hypothetical protein
MKRLFFMEKDIKIWKGEIESIATEIAFYQRVLSSYLKKKDTKCVKKQTFFLEKCVSICIDNQNYLGSLNRLVNQVVQLKECDDMQCEMYFLDKHADFKSNIETYLSDYREFKKEIFVCLNEWVEEYV